MKTKNTKNRKEREESWVRGDDSSRTYLAQIRFFFVSFVFFVCFVSALACSNRAFAQAEEVVKPDPVVEARMKALAEELRCLVCQNQTIADSHAPLALDLRNQIRTQIAQGRSDSQIRDYMVERYGDFVLYRPPFKATTALLWVGPFALVGIGAGIFLLMVRRRGAAGESREEVGAKRRAELEKLLADRGGEPR
jgi:cytochrome c-type biogenesis protein CcmH